MFYERSVRLWEQLSHDLNYNVMFSQRGQYNLCHSPASLDAARLRGNIMRAQRHRRRIVRPRRGDASSAVSRLFTERALPDHRRAVPGPRRHGAARCGGMGLSRAAPIAMASTSSSNARSPAFFGRATGSSVSRRRGADPRRQGRPRRRRPHRPSRRQGGTAAADRDARAAGLRVRAAEADDRHGRSPMRPRISISASRIKAGSCSAAISTATIRMRSAAACR